MTQAIRTAMVLAAGLGTRMRPLTDDRPKPMVEVGGKMMIDWVLDDLADAGFSSAIINLHYHADLLRQHLSTRQTPEIFLSDETGQLLDTGGGVAAAMPLFNDDVFLITNSDALWQSGLTSSISKLMDAWSDDSMDALLLLAEMDKAFGFDGAGDFFLDGDGTPVRRGEKSHAPMVYAGTQIVHRRLFDGCPQGAFSLNRLWNTALEQNRLKAVVCPDNWYHVGTPAAVEPTSKALNSRRARP